jgi:hypothetical protein
MNGVIEEYGVKLAQTTKGIWYCDQLIATGPSLNEAIAAADRGMLQIEYVLREHNKLPGGKEGEGE